MKIRPGQVNGPQQSGSSGASDPVRSTNGRFQVLLEHEIKDAMEKQPDERQQERDDQRHPFDLISNATRVLDDAIAEIGTGVTPTEKTIETLQELRNELRSLGHDTPGIDDAGIILSVETERLKSL